MEQKGLFFRIGIAILGGFAGLLALLVWIGSDTLRRPGIMMETYFGETVQGLEVGSQVKFRGVTIGSVRQISVAAAEYPQAVGETLATDPALRLVVVRFELIRERVAGSDQRDFRQMVDAGLRMRMASQASPGSSISRQISSTARVSLRWSRAGSRRPRTSHRCHRR
ncbi:MlaD family protein [Elioraea sp.]|uniref:MlaD family protein n=1 Tax=Elioraea sp. TaxID=2185103 RepID=UPI003F70F2BA